MRADSHVSISDGESIPDFDTLLIQYGDQEEGNYSEVPKQNEAMDETTLQSEDETIVNKDDEQDLDFDI